MYRILWIIRLSCLQNTLAQECTSVYILELQVCRANTLLRGTTAIRGAVEQLYIRVQLFNDEICA